jgi:hypothetical protein
LFLRGLEEETVLPFSGDLLRRGPCLFLPGLEEGTVLVSPRTFFFLKEFLRGLEERIILLFFSEDLRKGPSLLVSLLT